jgi:hypothetical protein
MHVAGPVVAVEAFFATEELLSDLKGLCKFIRGEALPQRDSESSFTHMLAVAIVLICLSILVVMDWRQGGDDGR